MNCSAQEQKHCVQHDVVHRIPEGKARKNEYKRISKGTDYQQGHHTPDGGMVEKHTDRNKETKKPEARSKL